MAAMMNSNVDPEPAQNGVQVLVADDDPMQRMKLSVLLRKGGYEVVEAVNGAEAWGILHRQSIRLLFTDWMMPEMNGLELIKAIREADLGHYIYIILCTGKDSKTELVEGIRTGADDFLSKPANPDELRARLHAGERVIALENKLASEKESLSKAYQSLATAHGKINSDLRAAAKLQMSLLPRPGSQQGVHFDWVFRPTSQVAGDIFNVFPLDRNHVGFYQLDVSGHGVTAAMLSFSLSKTLQATPMRDCLVKRITSEPPYYRVVPPDEVVRDLNSNFQNDDDMYFTIVYGVFNTSTGHLQMTQAGHPNPILTSQNSSPRLLGDGGFPVASLPEINFDLMEQELKAGDRLIFCSDGVTECADAGEEQFGMGRVIESLNRGAGLSLTEQLHLLEADLLCWRGGEEFEDDVSVLALEIS